MVPLTTFPQNVWVDYACDYICNHGNSLHMNVHAKYIYGALFSLVSKQKFYG